MTYCFNDTLAQVPNLGLLGLLAVVLLLLIAVAWIVFRWRKNSAKKISHNTTLLNFNAAHYNLPSLVNAIEQLPGRPRTVLLAANNVADLPVTVPVNLAIQMAKKGKCLLIDLDLNRDSVAKVFEADLSKSTTNLFLSSLPTAIDDLFIWPAGHFEKARQMNLGIILREAQKKYDCILLYAPYLTTLADRKQIAGCVKQAFIFGAEVGKNDKLPVLLKTFKCNILQPA